MTTYIKRYDSEQSEKRFSAKDVFNFKDRLPSLGIREIETNQEEGTASVIQKICDAGYSFTGFTNLDPLCLDMSGENPVYGKVLNPVFPHLPCLGSSCGSAASVIEDNLAFSLGTDSGGSVRAPAASANLWGFKATADFFPRDGIWLSHASIDAVGILAQESKQIRAVLEIFGSEASRGESRKIAIPDNKTLNYCDEVVRDRFCADIEILKESYDVQPLLTLDHFEDAIAIRKVLIAWSMRRLLNEIEGEFGIIKALRAFANSLEEIDVERCNLRAAKYRENWVRILRTTTILSPTLPSVSLYLNNAIPLNFFLCSANILDVPTVSFPVGKFSYPYSLQVFDINGCNFSALSIAEQISGKLYK